MKMRLMHVKPDGVNRTWDIILLDDRQNARVNLNTEGTEFIDLVILEGADYRSVVPRPVEWPSHKRVEAETLDEYLDRKDNRLDSNELIESKDNILKLER